VGADSSVCTIRATIGAFESTRHVHRARTDIAIGPSRRPKAAVLVASVGSHVISARIPPTLRHADGALVLLDQRVLPGHCRDVRCSSASEVATAIREMVVRGAPAIGVAAAYGVALAAREAAAGGATPGGAVAAVENAGRLLVAARPTAVNLAAAVDRMVRAAREAAVHGAAALARAVEAEAAALEAFEVDASRTMGRLGADLLPDAARVLVHCNAGALATVTRGTALAAVYEQFERGRLRMVYVDETRPRLQGSRLTAFELGAAGVPHAVVVDSLAATLMRQGEIDAVLVGADRIAANGDVANKVGTYALAVACAHHGVPLIVVAPTTTVDPWCADGASIPIEDRDPAEVTSLGDEMLAPAGSRALNPAFDVTPAALVHALVTERGVASPVNQQTVQRVLDVHDPS
jgi:methylthioribose-1-phosphate isomerase